MKQFISISILFFAAHVFSAVNTSSTTINGNNNNTIITQSGDQNSASQTINPLNGVLAVENQSDIKQVHNGNTAHSLQTGSLNVNFIYQGLDGNSNNNKADISQQGNQNLVDSDQRYADDNDAQISQMGDKNSIELLQWGGNNSSIINQLGNENKVIVRINPGYNFQNNQNVSQQGNLNYAHIHTSSESHYNGTLDIGGTDSNPDPITIDQMGDHNKGTIYQMGDYNGSIITQYGNYNIAKVNQSGNYNKAIITQSSY